MLDALSWEVMNATADDWESLDQILPKVHRFLGPATADDIAEIIARLVGNGLMEGMRPSPVDSRSILRKPIEYWFRMTPRGRMLWQSEAPRFEGGPGS